MELVYYLLKSVAILSIFYVVYFVFLKKDTLFNAKRHFFLAGMLAALFFPFLEFTQIVYLEQPIALVTSDIISTTPTPQDFTASTHIAPVASNFNWWLVAFTIYAMGLVIFLGRLVLQLFSLLRLLKSYPSIKRGRYRFVEIDQNFSPFSFFRYIVYNPTAHTTEELEMILKHEKVHAAQWHSIDILSIQLLRAIQWINPFSWWYKKSVEENLEFLADHHTVSQLPSKKQYQLTLVKASSPILAPALTTQFYQSFIKKRIIMLNTNTSKRHNLWKLSLVLPFLAFFLWSFNVKEEVRYSEPIDVSTDVDKLPEFLVSSETSNTELNAIEAKLTQQSKLFKVSFADRTRNTQGKLTQLSIDTQFPGQTRKYKNVTYGGETEEIASLKLKVVADELQFGSLDDAMVMRATAKGVVALTFPKKEKEEEKQLLGKNPLYIINGKATNKEDLPKDVHYEVSEEIIEIPKKEAMETYGTQAKDGAVVFQGTTTIKKDQKIEPIATAISSTPSTAVTPSLAMRSAVQEYRVRIHKNTTDTELEIIKNKVRDDHGVDLSYTVVRNDKREITSISLSYNSSGNNGSYSVNDDKPIDEFYFFAKENGDLGFWSEAHEKRRKERELEHQARLEEHKERMEEHKDRMADHKERMEERTIEMEERKEEMKAQMEERKEEMKQRQQELRAAQRQYRTNTQTSGSGNYSYTSQGTDPAHSITITKDTSDTALEAIKSKMALKNISFSYSKLRRNKNGEITAIKVVTDNGKGSKSTVYTKTDDGEPIDALVIAI